jgi:urease accessory protein
MGELRLGVGISAGRSVALSQYHRGALRLLRPHYLDDSGQACYTMVNPGGAYLGGDLYTIDVAVDDGARLLLTTQSATKVYRTPGSCAEQRMDVRLGPGSSLEYVPDQLIAYRGASYRQSTRIDMDLSASLLLAEVVTPGWSPEGAGFRYDSIRMRTDIRRGGRLLAIDNVLLDPAAGGDVTGLGFMEGHSHLGSMLVVDPRVDAALLDEVHALLAPYESVTRTGLTGLNGPGFAVRSLASDTAVLNALFGAISTLLRGRWFGQGPLDLRKY